MGERGAPHRSDLSLQDAALGLRSSGLIVHLDAQATPPDVCTKDTVPILSLVSTLAAPIHMDAIESDGESWQN